MEAERHFRREQGVEGRQDRRQQPRSRPRSSPSEADRRGWVTRVEIEESEDGVGRQPLLDWWTALAMLLAWVLSLPLTVAFYVVSPPTPIWFAHLILGGPTAVSLFALVSFFRVAELTEATSARVCRAIFLAPVFWIVGTLAFLFTIGLGSIAFCWFVLAQASRHRSIGGREKEGAWVAR